MAKYVGIDPGSKGSLCCLDTDDLTTVHFMDTPHDSLSCTTVRKWLLDWNVDGWFIPTTDPFEHIFLFINNQGFFFRQVRYV